MAENAGGIFYTVDAKTEGLIDAGKRAVDSLDDLNAAFDKVDKGAKGAEKAVDSTGGALVDLGRDAKGATTGVDTAGTALVDLGRDAKGATTGVDAADKAVVELGRDAKGAGTGLDKLDQSQRKAGNSASGFATRLTPLAALIGGLITAQSLANLARAAGEFTLLQNRIARLSPDLATATTTYQSLLTVAANTGQTVPNTVKLWETLTTSLKSLGATNAEVVSLTDTLQKIGKIGGSSAEETANALRQLGQSLAGGTLRAEEFNSIAEQTPELIRQLAAGAGMSMGEFRQAMLDGKISAELLFDLLLGRTTAVDTEFKKLPRSAADAGNAVQIAFAAAASEIDKALGASQRLAKALDALAKGTRQLFNPTDQEKFNALLVEREKLQASITQAEGTWRQNMPGQVKAREQLAEVEKQLGALRDANIERLKKEAAEQAKRESGTDAPKTTTDGQKAIKALQQQTDLLNKQGEARAVLAALQAANVAADSAEGKQIAEIAASNYQLAEAEKARQKAKTDGVNAAKQASTEAANAIKQENEEARRGYEQNQGTIQRMAEALAYASLQGEALAVAQAKAQLNKFASPEDVAEVERLTKALIAAQQAKSNQQLLGQVDPIVGAQQGYEAELAKYQQLNDAKLLSDQRYLELKGQLDAEHAATMQQLEEQRFAQQSKGNALLIGTLNQVQAAGTQAFTGLLTGATNGQEAVQQLGQALLNEVVGSLVQVGVQYLKNLAIQSSAGSAAAAVSAAQGAATAAAWAPAAAAASIGTLGGAAGVGLSAVAAVLPAITGLFGGGRKAGGPVNAGTMYRVNEGGAPEVFNAGGQQYMIPNMRGEVVSNRDATNGAAGSGGAGTTVNIHNNNGSNVRTSSKQMDRQEIIDVFIDDYMNGGQTSKAISTGTGTKRRGT